MEGGAQEGVSKGGGLGGGRAGTGFAVPSRSSSGQAPRGGRGISIDGRRAEERSERDTLPVRVAL
jgi:hypothetical protein